MRDSLLETFSLFKCGILFYLFILERESERVCLCVLAQVGGGCVGVEGVGERES